MMVCTYVTFQSSMSRSPSCPLCHLSLALDTKLVVQTVCIPYRVWWWRAVANKDDKATQNSSHWQTTSALGWLSGTWGLRPGGVRGWCLTDKELMWVPVDTIARCEELSVQSCIIRGDVKEKASPAYVWDKATQRQRCGVSWLWGCVKRWGISTWEVWWEQQWQLHTTALLPGSLSP